MPRIEFEDGIYHVVARGNERRAIFSDPIDRERFLEILANVSERYRLRVLAYCLMTNHYHLLAQTPDANLARAMRQLNGVYAQAYNRRHQRDGHLFQGRYGARLVQADDHLLSSVRYIVRNPLRAGLCERLEEWRWSSHLATIGVGPAEFLANAQLLSHFGQNRHEACARYLELVTGNEEFPSHLHPLVDGDDAFVEKHLASVQPSPEYPRASLRPTRRRLEDLVTDKADAGAVARAHVEHGYSMREIALHLGCGIATVHRRVRSYEADAERNVEDLTPAG